MTWVDFEMDATGKVFFINSKSHFLIDTSICLIAAKCAKLLKSKVYT